jgi:hypothetical protein
MKSWPPLLETNILNSFRHFLLIVFLYLQKIQINQIKIQINQSSSNLAKKNYALLNLNVFVRLFYKKVLILNYWSSTFFWILKFIFTCLHFNVRKTVNDILSKAFFERSKIITVWFYSPIKQFNSAIKCLQFLIFMIFSHKNL